MKVILKTLPLLFLLLVACKSTKSVVDASGQSKRWEPTDKALLWKVTKEGHRDSYIFGTIHLIDKEDFFLPAGTKEALAASDQIVYEISLDAMDDLGTIMELMTHAFMKNDTTLSDLLSEEEYQMVADHFDQMGLPMMMLRKIKPMFLSVLAEGDMMPNLMNGGGFVSYEFELDEMADELGLAKSGLETVEYQMSLFDQIPYGVQAEMLVDAIQSEEEIEDGMLDKLTEIYLSQDIKAMHDLSATDPGGLDQYTETLLYTRNANWVPQIAEITKDSRAFIAVGAGHLGGESGVLALLREAGFEVEAATTHRQE